MEHIASDAMLLPVDDRLALAHRLLASAEAETGRDLDALWEAEIRARMTRYKNGESAAVDIAEVFKEIEKKLEP